MPPATPSEIIREAAATGTDLPQHSLADPDRLEDHIRRQQFSDPEKEGESSPNLADRYPETPPKFTIDLSLPPEQRYLEVCQTFKEEIPGLTPLFDEVVGGMMLTSKVSLAWLHRICRLLLRGVADSDETRELKGISKATGVPIYLLVCFNVLLDLFMGCTSGGAAAKDGENETKMLHFRTLDWGMPSLRKVLVQLDFKTEPGGPIVASSLTYAGYVGVLTGVREGLSLSLNFRPTRNDKGKTSEDTKYFWHLIMVLLGRRRSISSELRGFLLPQKRHTLFAFKKIHRWHKWTYNDIIEKSGCQNKSKKPMVSTACYLCFSNGKETTVIEKDYETAVVRKSDDFIAVTNNDIGAERRETTIDGQSQNEMTTEKVPVYVDAMEAILHEAQDRRQCAESNYLSKRNARAKRDQKLGDGTRLGQLMHEDDIVELVQKYPTNNEETHFACIMDAKEGKVVWCRRWVIPITKNRRRALK